MKKTKTIFVDSDVFVALAKKDDTNHKNAIRVLEKLLKRPVSFFTSNYVFSETVTVISQKIGHQAGIAFINEIKSVESPFSIQWVTEKIEEEAIKIFFKQTSKNISFVDCTNMAIAKLQRAEAIFSFDSIYKKNDFLLAENL